MSTNSPKQWFNLEERFFAELDQQLLAKIQAEQANTHTAEDIQRVAGINDPKLAEHIAAIGVTVETLTAFRLVPLVAVAWADDRIEENERYVIMQTAEKSGIKQGDPSMELLKVWTTKRPPSELFQCWCDYTKSLSMSLNGEMRAVLKKEVIDQVRAVAQAAGGVIGFGSVSASEKAMIECIEKTLS
jgi:hypothetical protein